jgi:isopentenyldiphosphate isomerase
MVEMDEELLEIIDEEGNVLGLAPRSEIHGNPTLLHRVVHVLVFNSGGNLLLQKRSMRKDVAPGRWDTSVGGHVAPGEDLAEAARREMMEELAIPERLEFLYSYRHSNPYESELVHTFSCRHDGDFTFDREEIDEVRFWSIREILDIIWSDALSENFKHEITTYLQWEGKPF